MAKYGLPYQGSKNKIAERIVDLLPSAKHFYDLFAGGCAITQAALQSGKWECVHFSDICDSVILFRDCLEGNVPDGSEWISREEFNRRKDTDPYVRIVWSFGNNQRDYLYSHELEPYKKAVHKMLYAATPDERRLKFKNVCRLMGAVKCRPYDLESSEKNERLKSIARTITKSGYEARVADYHDVDILPDSIIYCDIPYKNTRDYRRDIFDHTAFYNWALAQTAPLYISEYFMPSDFECVAEFEHVSTFSATNNSLRKIERIYRPKHQL